MKGKNAFARQLFTRGSCCPGSSALATQRRSYRKDLSYKQPKFAETDQVLHNIKGKLVADRLTDDQREFKYKQTRGAVEDFVRWLKTDPDALSFENVDPDLVERYTAAKRAYFQHLHQQRKEHKQTMSRWIERRNEALRALPPRLRFVSLTQEWPGWAEKLHVPTEFPPAYDPEDVFQQPPWVRSTTEALGVQVGEGSGETDVTEHTFDISKDYTASFGASSMDDTDLFAKYGDLEVMRRMKGEYIPPPPSVDKKTAIFLKRRGPPEIDNKAKRLMEWVTPTDLKSQDSLDTILEGEELTRPQLADRGDLNRHGQFIPEGRAVSNFEEEVFEDVTKIFEDEHSAKAYMELMEDPDVAVFEGEMQKRKGKK